jgi:hypothetical protein
VKITIEVPDKHIDGALAEPHSKYWASEARWDPKKREGHVVEVDSDRDSDDVKQITHTLNVHALKSGLALLAAQSPRAFAMLLSGDYDGLTGDLLLQLMALGEIKYS